MISLLLPWYEVVLTLFVVLAIFVVSFVASITVIKRSVRHYAQPITRDLLFRAEDERDRYQIIVQDLTRRNRELVATLQQSAIYDRRIAEYVALRIASEQDAIILGRQIQEENEKDDK